MRCGADLLPSFAFGEQLIYNYPNNDAGKYIANDKFYRQLETILFNPLIFSFEKFKLRSSNNENSKNFEIERRNRLPLFDQVIKFDHVSKSTGQSLLCIITTSKERHLTLNPII